MALRKRRNAHALRASSQAADAAERLCMKIVSSLRERISALSPKPAEPLDHYQWVCYELAHCASEIAACRAMLACGASAPKPSQADAESLWPVERMVSCFTAETVRRVAGRIWGRLADFGLCRSDLAQTIERPSIRRFCEENLSVANLVKLAEQVQKAGPAGELPGLGERQLAQRARFREIAERVIRPLAERIHRENLLVPDEILKSLAEMGAFGLSIPRRFGGLQDDEQDDTLAMIVATEELTRGSLGAAGSLITRTEILARALRKGGTAEQQAYWLPRLAAGNPLCAVAVTEPDYGSDVASMKMSARPAPGGWLLNGAKTWCTFCGKAGLLLVLARTDPDASLGHRGLSLFLVEKPSTDGKSFDFAQPRGGRIRGGAIPTIGYRGMHSFWLVFENFFVPEEALLGGDAGLGKGFYFLMAGFEGGRIQTAARATGVMQAAFEEALAYAARRKVFGLPVAEYQLTKVKVADMATRLVASRQFTYEVARRMDQGQGKVEASMVKLFTCRAAEGLTREAMQIHGGKGYAEGTPASRHFVDARVLSIFEGAEETLALKVIARSLVESDAGLPGSGTRSEGRILLP